MTSVHADKPSMVVKTVKQLAPNKIVRIVFIALLLDLLAFTMPLPLFPRLINDFVSKEAALSSTSPTLLSHTLTFVRYLRTTLFSFSSLTPLTPSATSRLDLTLLGGLLSSLFSLCQFVISPRLGALSDAYGRRPILLFSLAGNLLSGALWLFSRGFGTYALSRVVGGLSEGNIQLSIAIISDVTTPETRSRALALVGVAFSVAFTLGPSLGAYFAARTFGRASKVVLLGGWELELNGFAVAAAVTLVLLLVETIYLAAYLPETRWYEKEPEVVVQSDVAGAEGDAVGPPRTLEERQKRLKDLEWLHLGFLFFFSGAEFSLTFLTYTLFDFTNVQNGKLLGFIGILSSLLQGGYVRRRRATPSGPSSLALAGTVTCAISLFLLALLPHSGALTSALSPASILLYASSAGLAFVSATVVNSLNALASLECSATTLAGAQGAEIEKGRALGTFRSRGQLGRAIGPLVATAIFWMAGPSWAYGVAAVGAGTVAMGMRRIGNSGMNERSSKGKGKTE